ncbi:MAG: response regulator [Pirellulaceae bacterium]
MTATSSDSTFNLDATGALTGNPAPIAVTPESPGNVDKLGHLHTDPRMRYDVNAGRRDPRLSTVMIIDDEPVNIKVTRRYLQLAGYENFITTSESRQAFSVILERLPDLILLDVMMPEVSGLEILQQVRSTAAIANIPVLILTASTDAETKSKALELGATDFLAKPVVASDLLPRVRNALILKAHQDHLERYAEHLEREVQRRTEELHHSRREVVEILARAAECRDDDTGHHIVRVGLYAAIIAKTLGCDHRFVELIEQAAQLHDVGKIAIPDAILMKPSELTDDEFALMRKHCYFGQKILLSTHEESVATSSSMPNGRPSQIHSPLVHMAAVIAATHHERWDGKGYPNGLKGDQIPLEGRITAVADVYDALSSRRPYKPPFSQQECFDLLLRSRGTHFDPRVLDAFFQSIQHIERIRSELADGLK